MMTKKKLRHFAVVVVFIFGVLFFGAAFLRYVPPVLFRTFIKSITPPLPPPEKLFSQYVLSPIPKSVKNIRADKPKNIGGYRYTFRFNISRDDIALITDSRPFVRVWNVEYKNGDIWWSWDQEGPFGIIIHNTNAICYDHTHEPGWFKPGQWDNPEAYVFEKVGNFINAEAYKSKYPGPMDQRVLLYNENESEAYFIIMYTEGFF
jgi:hypothetical protein